MRYRETRWKENLCNSLGSMLWSLFNRNNNKEAKVYARGSKYQSVTPCSYFLNQASFWETSLVSTNESCLDKWVSFWRMSLVSRNKSRFDKWVPILEQTSLVENQWVVSQKLSDPNFFGFHCQKYKQVLSCCHTHIYIYIYIDFIVYF